MDFLLDSAPRNELRSPSGSTGNAPRGAPSGSTSFPHPRAPPGKRKALSTLAPPRKAIISMVFNKEGRWLDEVQVPLGGYPVARSWFWAAERKA